MTIDFNPLSWNAESAISSNIQPLSNVTTQTSDREEMIAETNRFSIDADTQMRPPLPAVAIDDQSRLTTPSSTNTGRLKLLGTPLSSVTEAPGSTSFVGSMDRFERQFLRKTKYLRGSLFFESGSLFFERFTIPQRNKYLRGSAPNK
jgi:hypothetical protein